jgi:hypothetical protein
VLNELNNILPEFGMSLNGDKTVWMPFLPTSKFGVEIPDPFRVQLGSDRLSCVDDFVYLGYSMNPFSGSQNHLRARRNLLFSSARSCGRLFRKLKLTNMRSLRAYFLSMVGSQLYGIVLFNFSPHDY